MLTELDQLITHLQQELNYLQSEMDACITDWDFKSAIAYKKPLAHTKRQLLIAKCLENPNYKKIMILNEKLNMMELSIKMAQTEYGHSSASQYDHITSDFIKKRSDEIEKYKGEIEKLQSPLPKIKRDDDQMLSLLEEMGMRQFGSNELELISDKVYLKIEVQNDCATMKLIAQNDININNYIFVRNFDTLKSIGFDRNFEKIIINYKQTDKKVILETIAVLTFEVFDLVGNKDISNVVMA